LTHALTRKRDTAGAIAAGERALAIREAKLGKDHLQVAAVLVALSDADVLLGTPEALERGAARASRALEIQAARFGPEHLQIAHTLDRVGFLAAARGQREVALENFRIALGIRQKNLGEHNDVGYSHLIIGELLLEMGRAEPAYQSFQRCYDLWRKLNGDKDADVAKARGRMGDARLAQRRYPDALTLYDEALAMAQAGAADPQKLGEIRYGRAQALLAAGRTQDALAEARAVRETLVKPEHAALRGKIDGWLKGR
jgi:tetratricopeptide (TPR) repeat protein